MTIDNNRISDLFNELIKVCTPNEEIDYVDELDRNYDANSESNIWRQSFQSNSFSGLPLYQLLQTIKNMMDKHMKEHPTLSYFDFGFTTNSDIDYAGQLTCDFEWLESDKEKEKRLNEIKEEKAFDENRINQMLQAYKLKYKEDFKI